MTLKASHKDAGFSLTELLVVMGLIGVMAAASLPAIGRFIRNYRVRGAAQQVVGEIQTARSKAIAKNVNLGVVFIVRSPTEYQYIIEDDVSPPIQTNVAPVPVATLLSEPQYADQRGPKKDLPAGMAFGTACSGFTGNDGGFRFNRLGGWCDPTGSSGDCPTLGTGGVQQLVMNDAAGSSICVEGRGVTRRVRVSPGGRPVVE